MRHRPGASIKPYEFGGHSVLAVAAGAGALVFALAFSLDPYTGLALSAAFALPVLLGALLNLQRQRRALRADELRQLARRQIHHFESHIDAAMQALDQAHARLQLTCANVLQNRHQPLPASEKAALQRQLRIFRAQFERITEQCTPRAWTRHGLHGALGDGPIAQALETAGVDYHLAALRGLEHASPALQRELYRLACAAVASLLEQGATRLDLRLRGGPGRGRAWAVLSVESAAAGLGQDTGREASAYWLGRSASPQLLAASATLGEGRVRLREFADGRRRIGVLLQDLPPSG